MTLRPKPIYDIEKSYLENAESGPFFEGLTELKANGTYHKLLIKWDLYDPADNNL